MFLPSMLRGAPHGVRACIFLMSPAFPSWTFVSKLRGQILRFNRAVAGNSCIAKQSSVRPTQIVANYSATGSDAKAKEARDGLHIT